MQENTDQRNSENGYILQVATNTFYDVHRGS